MGLDSALAQQLIDEANLLQPTCVIQLEASDDVIARRLAQRSSKPLKTEWLQGVRTAYKVCGYQIIDTTLLDREEVASSVIRILIERGVITK